MKRIIIIGFVFSLLGCSHTVLSTKSPAVNIYTSYGEKMKGPVALVIEYDLRATNQEIKPSPSTHICSAHSYEIMAGDDLAFSIKTTTDAMFEQVVEEIALPTKDEMHEKDIQGTIYVRLNRFYPTISFSRGVWETNGMASCDIVLDVIITDSENKDLLVTTVEGTKVAEGGRVHASCHGGADILSKAVSQGIHETMERYAESVSKSDKIRKAFAVKRKD